MTFDMGLQGLGILLAISLLFGAASQLLLGLRRSRWVWLIGAVAWFAGGMFASEVVWGTLTVDEIQPIIDGLALDESLLGGLLAGVTAIVVTWLLTRGPSPRRGPMAW